MYTTFMKPILLLHWKPPKDWHIISHIQKPGISLQWHCRSQVISDSRTSGFQQRRKMKLSLTSYKKIHFVRIKDFNMKSETWEVNKNLFDLKLVVCRRYEGKEKKDKPLLQKLHLQQMQAKRISVLDYVKNSSKSSRNREANICLHKK